MLLPKYEPAGNGANCIELQSTTVKFFNVGDFHEVPYSHSSHRATSEYVRSVIYTTTRIDLC